MTIVIKPGPQSSAADRLTARERERLLDSQLSRIRETATTWRNALGALLVGLIGFGLLKGRNEVGQLATPWAQIVGGLLALGLTCGAVGALALVRAATGKLAMTSHLININRQAADHIETEGARTAARCGIALTLTCTFFLVTAVGITWYGPPAKPLKLVVTTSGEGTTCGPVVRVGNGTLVLKTDAGEVSTTLSEASSILAASSCSPK